MEARRRSERSVPALLTEARNRLTTSRLGSSYARETDKDLLIIRDLADELEARFASPHIVAKHWAEVCRLRAEVRRLSEQSQSEPEYVGDLRAELAEAHKALSDQSIRISDMSCDLGHLEDELAEARDLVERLTKQLVTVREECAHIAETQARREAPNARQALKQCAATIRGIA